MDIVVLVKQVPDTWAERRLAESDYTLDRESVDAVMNELDEYAVEEALRLKEAHGGEVTVLSMGPERATETIRKALSMGADKAVHVSDPALHGAARYAAQTLAAALGTIPYDLVVLGSESTDARLSVMAAMLAERLACRSVRRPQVSVEEGADGSTVTIGGRRRPASTGCRARRRPWSAWSRRSTSRGTRRSRGSWPRRRSRCRPSPSPTSASTPARWAWPARPARWSR